MVNPTEYVPKSYRPKVSTYWWVARWPYLKFILREASSVFVAWSVVLTLMQVRALIGGPEQYSRFQQWLQGPLVLALNAVTLAFLLFHALTWFHLAPKAMVVRLAGTRVPGALIVAANYAGWAAVSGMIAWFVLGG
jgi:fumarate reductase subunit C